MNGIYFYGYADVVAGPSLNAGQILPAVLILSVIIATVLLIRHFINKKN